MSGRIICGDARKAQSLIPDESVHLVVTSPPYNVGIDYEDHEDTLTWDEWRSLMHDVLLESWRTLVPGGRMAVNMAYGINRNPVMRTGTAIEDILSGFPGALYRGPVCWYKRNAVSTTGWGSFESPSNPVLRGTFEMIYVFSKGQPDRVDRKGPGDLPRKDWTRATLDVWEISPQSDTSLHPVPFPPELVRRLMQFYTWPGDHLLDPFAGSGTTALVAEHGGRDWTMVELSQAYCEVIQKRAVLFEGVGMAPIEHFPPAP